MYYRTFRGSFYVLYGALTIGLLLTSILAPLEYREVNGYELYLYGVRVIYDEPPPVVPPTTTGAPSNSTDTNTTSHATESDLSVLDQERLSSRWLYSFAELRSDVTAFEAEGDPDAVSASSSASSSSSSSSAGPATKVRHTIYLHRLPHSKLRSVMIAYLFFAGASLAASLVVITIGFLNVMPPTRYVFLSRHSYFVFIICMLLVTLTFAMAAVCVSQNAMYKVVGNDYYAQSQLVVKTYYRKARSGFSCTVAAVGVGIIMIISIGVSLTRAI